jgi:hypothetical protein
MRMLVASASGSSRYVRKGCVPPVHGVIVTASGRRVMGLCERIRIEQLGPAHDRPITCERCLRQLRTCDYLKVTHQDSAGAM